MRRRLSGLMLALVLAASALPATAQSTVTRVRAAHPPVGHHHAHKAGKHHRPRRAKHRRSR
jgi:hypothetical protein